MKKLDKFTIKEFSTYIKRVSKPSKQSALLFFLGLSSIFLFAPFNFFFLGFFTFSFLAKELFNKENYISTLNTLLYFFLGFYLGIYYWISFSFLVNKNYILFFPIIFIIIPLYFTILSSLFLSLIYYLKAKLRLKLFEFILFYSFLLFIHEYLRGHIVPFIDFKGLPWNLLGYSISNTTLVQIISVIGVYGLTFITIYLFHSFTFFWYKPSKKLISLILSINIASLSSLYAFGFIHINKSNMQNISNDKILLLHTNFSKHHGYDQEKILDNIISNISLLNSNTSDKNVVILPEGTIPVATENNFNPAIHYIIEHLLDHPHNSNINHLIIGSPRLEQIKNLNHYFNSLMITDNEGNIKEHYDKVNLVPFGEYVPYLNIFPRLAVQKNFSKGNSLKTLSITSNNNNDISFVPLICYDGIFSGKMSKEGSFLLNITNDIWFTKKILNFNISLGTWHHFDHIRFRSIEEGKPLIRVANYGITGVTDSFGRIINKVTFNDNDQAIIVTLPPKITNPTFFNKHRHLIVYILIIINSFTLLLIFLKRKIY